MPNPFRFRPNGVVKMKMLDFWRRKSKRLPVMAMPVVPSGSAVGHKGRNSASALSRARAAALSRARAADTDGRARRRNQLVEDNRLL